MKPIISVSRTGGDIFVIDYPTAIDETCNCGKNVQFTLGINDNRISLCEECIAEVAKRIIDGLT